MKRKSSTNSNAAAAATAGAGYDSEWSDGSLNTKQLADNHYNSSNSNNNSSKPKKRFIWPDELHRDFLAAVFDVGLRTADHQKLVGLLPELDQQDSNSLATKATLQKLRSFRYQSRHSHSNSSSTGAGASGGQDATQEFRLSDSESSVHSASVDQSAALLARLATEGAGNVDRRDSQRHGTNTSNDSRNGNLPLPMLPEEVQRIVDKLESKPLRHNAKIVAQCIQVQCSIQSALKQTISRQKVLKDLLMNKAQELGLPYQSMPPVPSASQRVLDPVPMGDSRRDDHVRWAHNTGGGSSNTALSLPSNSKERASSFHAMLADDNLSQFWPIPALPSLIGAAGDPHSMGGSSSGVGPLAAMALEAQSHAGGAGSQKEHLHQEMKTQMEFHRQMLQRQHSQLQLHGSSEHAGGHNQGGGSSSGTGGGSASGGVDSSNTAVRVFHDAVKGSSIGAQAEALSSAADHMATHFTGFSNTNSRDSTAPPGGGSTSDSFGLKITEWPPLDDDTLDDQLFDFLVEG